MREGRQLVRDTKRFAEERRGLSWWYLLSALFLFTAALYVACLDVSWFVRLPAALLVALLHMRLFVIFHDYQHGAILSGSPLAGGILWLYGLLSVAPRSVWKETHDEHHRHNMRNLGLESVGSYPVMTTEEYLRSGRGVRFAYAFSRHPLTIALGYFTVFLWGFGLRPFLQNPRRHWDAGLAVAVHLGMIVALAVTRPDILLVVVGFPFLLSMAVGSYLFYAQHNFPEARIRGGDRWDYVFAALQSCSYLRMHPILCWFTANIGYHHVHHLNARIPFYRLPEAMASLPELQSPGTTTLWPRDVLRCLRLKLWDPARGRFVSFKEGREASSVAAV